jgi:2-keto-4-pentenoate hydratase
MTASNSLSQRLAQARDDRIVIETPPDATFPADSNAAYAIQHETLGLKGASIGGWKVGAKSPGGPSQCAPLPASDVHSTKARLSRRDFVPLALELEIAFRFSRVFEPRGAAYSSDEVLANIAETAAAIEIVASRYSAWPNVDKLLQLADLQNHGALIVGEFQEYDETFPFLEPALSFTFGERLVSTDAAANPAGDPRSLLPWLVNHITGRGIAVTPEMVMTTGSYTGMFFPQSTGTATGTFADLPPVCLELAW